MLHNSSKVYIIIRYERKENTGVSNLRLQSHYDKIERVFSNIADAQDYLEEQYPNGKFLDDCTYRSDWFDWHINKWTVDEK